MLKKLIKTQIKDLLVPGLIAAIVIITIALYTGLINDPIYELNYHDHELLPYSNCCSYSHIINIFIPATAISMFFPMWVFNYRFSLSKADIYYQTPFGEKTIKRVRALILLSFILIAFIIGTQIMGLSSIIKYYTIQLDNAGYVDFGGNDYAFLKLAELNISYFIIETLVSMAVISSQYFISCYLVSKTNSVQNSLVVICAGNFIFALSFLILYGMINKIVFGISSHSRLPSYLDAIGFSSIHSGIAIHNFFEALAGGCKCYKHATLSAWNNTNTMSVINLCVFSILGIAAAIGVLCEKDPSGEYCGKGETDNPFQSILVHTAFGLVLSVSFFIGIIGGLVMIIIETAVYYMVISWVNRSFKICRKDLIPLVINASVGFALTFISKLF